MGETWRNEPTELVIGGESETLTMVGHEGLSKGDHLMRGTLVQ